MKFKTYKFGTVNSIEREASAPFLLSSKGIEVRNGLMKDIRSRRLNEADTAVAKSLVKDLKNALSGQ